mmetsp:Transcript_455/g.559  ORF Transcript_455/g.559 Transcript_455/m.559 type:complete len:112 (+) Transcript_455:183-518(+)
MHHTFKTDGLYVLVKEPVSKSKNKKTKEDIKPTDEDDTWKATVPSNLKSYMMEQIPANDCPWSLSGPQFPRPTAIQQRYCYPKGDPSYSDKKGAALWTMVSGSPLVLFQNV